MARLLEGDSPVMISRLGHTEAKALVGWMVRRREGRFLGSVRWLSGYGYRWWWTSELRAELANSSGFFPNDDRSIQRLCEIYARDVRAIDVLGSWLALERVVSPLLERATTVPLADLEPFWFRRPWTRVLVGKKVLVVHPFAATIRKQYALRRLLFSNPEVLPDFELEVLPAVQALGGTADGFESWFDALGFMCDEVSERDFDVAIIGAGAFGLPLAAHVKRLGRKAVHLGGATQLLFGIRGARWEDRPSYNALMNMHWTRPSSAETPATHSAVDGGRSYW
ncbi:hypothetical protein [Congregicoccus parvus]|uniref:hypothetical protein n=1 Tax=Congregicoccus parvus TaxID=3081749 RepID=UPI003FA60A1E